MGTWRLNWNFNAPSYRPGQIAEVYFWLHNQGNLPLYLSNFEMRFDFGIYDVKTVSGQIMPGKRGFLGRAPLELPADAVGTKTFSFQYRMHQLNGNSWIDIGSYHSERPYFISVYPFPFYNVFVSRGIGIADRAIGDPIVEMVREWGFQTTTVGVEIEVAEDQVPRAVREQIKIADAVIVIATPRFLDALSGLWRTLEWAHGELGIGYGVDKPLFLIKDRQVSLGGLPSYLTSSGDVPILEFDTYGIDDLRQRLPTVMPGFREWIETRRRLAFFDSLGKIAMGGLAVVGAATVLAGIIGELDASSD